MLSTRISTHLQLKDFRSLHGNEHVALVVDDGLVLAALLARIGTGSIGLGVVADSDEHDASFERRDLLFALDDDRLKQKEEEKKNETKVRSERKFL